MALRTSHSRAHTPRIVTVITRLEGGAGLLALRGALALPEVENTIVTGHGGRLVEQASAAGLEVIVEPSLVADLSLVSDARALRRLSRVMSSGRFSVVHTHCAKAGAIGRAAAHYSGIPLIVHTYHGLPFNQFQSAARRRAYVSIERHLGRVTDIGLCVGVGVAVEAVRQRLMPPQRLRTIGVVVDGPRASAAAMSARSLEARRRARTILGIPLDAEVVGVVGRLTYQKAPEHFLAALTALDRPGLIGLWVGGGDLAERCADLVSSLSGLKIVFAGERSDVLEILPAFDIFALPSRYEGLPTAIVEAMICGVPVVATAVNAVSDLVVPGETGLLVAPGRPLELAAAIAYLLESPTVAAQMADTAYDRLEKRFCMERLRETLLCVYGLRPEREETPLHL